MKSKILSLISLSILSLVLMVSLASATGIDLVAVDIPTTANHNSEVTLTFNITHDDSIVNQTGLDWSGSTSSIGTFTTLPTLTAINDSEEFTLSAVLSIPQHASGTITLDLNAVSDTSDTAEFTTNPTITINDSKELAVSSATISEGSNSTTITITNNGNVDLTGINLTSTGDFDVNFSNTDFDLAKGISTTITVTATDDLYDLLGKTPSITITANSSDGTISTGTVSTTPSFCESVTNVGKLKVDITDLKVKQGFGDSDSYWYPFDVIEAEIEVDNDGSWDMDNIEVSWALYTTDGKKITNDKESDFKLDKSDYKTLTLTFALDKKVKKMEKEDLILYVKAQGKVDDRDTTHNNEESCKWDSQEVNLISNDKFVVLDSLDINGIALKDLKLENTIACGTELQIISDVWNIGDDKQKDVTVLIKNNELGISKKVIIGDINSFDYEKLDTTITIPSDAEAKEYTFDFMIYDEDNSIFETDDNDKAIFKVRVDVEGNCKAKESASITAALTSEANAGEQAIVKTTIKNTESKTVTYIINVKDYEEWATLEDLDSSSITLVAGESRDIELTFNLKKGISGNKLFKIETISDSEVVTTQPVSVSIAAQKSLLGGISLPGNNLYLWGIGALNAILILAIIVVAIRLSRD